MTLSISRIPKFVTCMIICVNLQSRWKGSSKIRKSHMGSDRGHIMIPNVGQTRLRWCGCACDAVVNEIGRRRSFGPSPHCHWYHCIILNRGRQDKKNQLSTHHDAASSSGRSNNASILSAPLPADDPSAATAASDGVDEDRRAITTRTNAVNRHPP